MRTGFVTEAHVVVYCDGCGDHYREHGDESICFDSVNQAIAYLTAAGAGVGWVYDGDKILCDGCQATARCAQHGHLFPVPWRWSPMRKSDARACEVCGISESEIEE